MLSPNAQGRYGCRDKWPHFPVVFVTSNVAGTCRKEETPRRELCRGTSSLCDEHDLFLW